MSDVIQLDPVDQVEITTAVYQAKPEEFVQNTVGTRISLSAH